MRKMLLSLKKQRLCKVEKVKKVIMSHKGVRILRKMVMRVKKQRLYKVEKVNQHKKT